MKVKYEGYKIGSDVWAISEYLNDGKSTNHVGIFPAKVKTVYFNYNKKTNGVKVEYWLNTPDGKEWGCEVSEEHVSDDFNELVEKMKKIWIKHANTF